MHASPNCLDCLIDFKIEVEVVADAFSQAFDALGKILADDIVVVAGDPKGKKVGLGNYFQFTDLRILQANESPWVFILQEAVTNALNEAVNYPG